jgi:alkaline phosphatase
LQVVGAIKMKKLTLFLLFCVLTTHTLQAKAKNVILFLGDAGGIPTLNIASIRQFNDPQKLFLQHLPQIALMDTSAADTWVTDSAAGMSAIVTGQKTNNGVLSQSASAVRGKKDGEILQTILEYAEQHGLSTGVLSNMNMTDATPAACYAHSNDRSQSGPIFAQIFTPRFGDGVDLVVGSGRREILAATMKIGLDITASLPQKGYAFYDSLQSITGNEKRVVALFDNETFDVSDAVERSIRVLSKNKKGYFLMVEWDMHTDHINAGLTHVIEMDNAIRKVAGSVKNDTLLLFTADHSFDLRLKSGRKGFPLVTEVEEKNGTTKASKLDVRMDDTHTGEQVLVAAQGPGSKRVHGFLVNTDIFQIMMAAYGWKK